MTLHAAAFIPLSLYGALAGSLPDHLNLLLSAHESCAAGRYVEAQVAQTPDQRSAGLSLRTAPLSPNEGMIFVADQSPDVQSFWMKNTYIPLTLLFFDSNSSLLSAYDMPVEADPADPTHFYTENRAPWVALEIAGGNAANFEPGATTVCVAAD